MGITAGDSGPMRGASKSPLAALEGNVGHKQDLSRTKGLRWHPVQSLVLPGAS